MATDYAPNAIVNAGRRADREIPGSTFSGVKGDNRHFYGYHRGRCVLKGDYSTRLPLDKKGPACACSALDMSFTKSQMKVVTSRLRASALDPNDPRMEPVREFYGTLNGSSVFGFTKDDLDGPWRGSSSDKSHLWHIHISFFRAFAENAKAIDGVIDVMAGVPWKRTEVKPTPPASSKTHTVQSGENLTTIAKRYGTTVKAIAALNGLANPNIINKGQVLRLPVAVKVPVAPRPTPKPPAELKRGSKGNAVRAFQKGMNRVFPAYSRLSVDGDFGPATDRVVREFQRRAGLKADGIIGTNTRRALARYGVVI